MGGTDLMTNLGGVLPFILIFVIMYFLILRPQQKRAKQHQEMVKNVRRGDTIVKAIHDTAFDLIVVNFANADMVGHSGKIPPTITAVETVDACLGQIYAALKRAGGAMIVTADHGNAEQMIDPATGGPQTAHTTNPVPFIVASEHAVPTAGFKGDARRFTLRPDGALQDIAPTMLGILGVAQPKEMTGHDLRVVADDNKP